MDIGSCMNEVYIYVKLVMPVMFYNKSKKIALTNKVYLDIVWKSGEYVFCGVAAVFRSGARLADGLRIVTGNLFR